MGDLREVYIFGIIAFYVVFGVFYLAIGNTLNEYNNEELPSLDYRNYDNPALNEDTSGLLGFVVKGINGYDEAIPWINYLFIGLTAMLILLIIMLIIHG